jgi:hypothetical protein
VVGGAVEGVTRQLREVPEIQRYFEDYFARWSITLPSDAVARRAPGHLFEKGWHIGFIWGANEQGEYLEFLAQHRMTNDRRQRVYASGEVNVMPVPVPMYVVPADATPEQEAEIASRHAREYRRESEKLRELGLLPPAGENRIDLEINEILRSWATETG